MAMNTESEPITHAVARNLRRFMDEKKLKQKEVAKRARIGQTTVSLWLNPAGRKEGETATPASGTLARLEALAKAVGVRPWELLAPADVASLVLSDDERAVILALRATKAPKAPPQPQPQAEQQRIERRVEPERRKRGKVVVDHGPTEIGRLVIKAATARKRSR